MSYDIDGKPLFDPYRIESAGPGLGSAPGVPGAGAR